MRSIELKRTAGLTGAALLALAMGACALEPGLPWGVIVPSLEVELGVAAGRLDATGRIRTVDDYRVVLEDMSVTVQLVSFVAGDSQALTFDPADPPPGYSLCHGGHCHADDGRLVDYADIAAELAGGGGAGAALVTVDGGVAAPTVSAAARVALPGCAEGCAVDEPVEVATARVVVTGLLVSGRVFDARTGDAARLGEEGVAFSASAFDAGLSLSVSALVGEEFGPGRDAGLGVALTLAVDASFLDGVPWDAEDPSIIESSLAERLREAVTLGVASTRRFEP